MDKCIYGFTTLQHNFYAGHVINNGYLAGRQPSLCSQFLIERIILLQVLSLN